MVLIFQIFWHWHWSDSVSGYLGVFSHTTLFKINQFSEDGMRVREPSTLSITLKAHLAYCWALVHGPCARSLNLVGPCWLHTAVGSVLVCTFTLHQIYLGINLRFKKGRKWLFCEVHWMRLHSQCINKMNPRADCEEGLSSSRAFIYGPYRGKHPQMKNTLK